VRNKCFLVPSLWHHFPLNNSNTSFSPVNIAGYLDILNNLSIFLFRNEDLGVVNTQKKFPVFPTWGNWIFRLFFAKDGWCFRDFRYCLILVLQSWFIAYFNKNVYFPISIPYNGCLNPTDFVSGDDLYLKQGSDIYGEKVLLESPWIQQELPILKIL